MIEPFNEELLEQLYWEFHEESIKTPENERLIFKGKMRYFAENGWNIDYIQSRTLEILENYLQNKK